MTYLINLIKSLKELIITYLLQYILIIVSYIIYLSLGKNNIQEFINNYCPYIIMIFYLLTIIYIYKKNKRIEPILPKTAYYPLVTIGISIACLLNMLIFLINTPNIITTISLPILFISSAVIGPIYEEIIFRYVILNRLKKFNSPKTSIIINSLIFALVHMNPIKIAYAFILGLILNIVYQKYNNIMAPIFIHASANTAALFLNEFNIYILILSIIAFIISTYINNTHTIKKI